MTESRSVVVRLSADTAAYIAQITAAGKATDKAFDGVDGKVDATNSRMVELEASTRGVGEEMSSTSTKTKALEKDLDSVSGRVKLLAQLGVALGPGLAPLGAVGIVGAVGLATQLGFVVGAAGATVLAFQGVGDALTAANEAAIIPTSENLAKANAEMSKLGPDAQALVTQLVGLRDVGADLRDRAAAGVLPGISSFLDDALTKAPAVKRVIGTLADATGEVFANAGKSLAGGRFNEFFQFLNRDAPRNISGLATATGNLAHAGTEVLEAFSPLELDFIDVLVSGTERLDKAASGLEDSDGFRNFVDYVRETGPQVAATAGAIGSALVDIASAAAPLGGPVLQTIEDLAHVFSEIADSDIGTPLIAAASGFTIFSRAQGLLERGGRVPFIRTNYVDPIKDLRGQIPTLGEFGTVLYRAGQSADHADEKTRAARESVRGFTRELAPVGKLAAGVGAIALASTGAADSLGLADAATLGLAGSMAGPYGAAIGTAVGLTLDFAHANDALQASIDAANAAASSTNIEDLVAAQDRLVASFAATADKGGFSGALGRVSSYLGGDVKEFREAYDDLQARINDLKDGSSGLTELLTSPFDGVARSAQLAALSVEDYTTAVQISLGLLSDQAAYDGYKAAVDSVTQALKDNGKTLDANTEKGRGNREVLRAIAQTALNYSTTIQDPGKRQDFLANARKQYIDAATDLGKLPKAARRAADELGLLGKVKAAPKVDPDTTEVKPKTAATKAELKALNQVKIKPLVGVDTDSAFAQMYGVDSLLTKIDRKQAKPGVDADTAGADNKLTVTDRLVRLLGLKTATPKVNVDAGGATGVINNIGNLLTNLNGRVATTYVRTVRQGGLGPQERADGGRITGPGGPRDDLVPVMASNGEFIVNARDTARNLALLEKINAGLPAYADGGETGTTKADRSKARQRARARAKANQAFDNLSVDITIDADGATSALDDFADDLDRVRNLFKDAGLRLSKAQLDQADDLRKGARLFDTYAKSLQATIDAQRDYESQVAGSINNDPFGNGLAGLNAQLDADTNDNNALLTALTTAVSNGLDGELFKALAASGDLNTAQQVAGLDRSGISTLEGKYAGAAGSRTALASYAGDRVFGQALADNRALIQRQSQLIDRQTRVLERLPGAVRDGAEKGAHDGTAKGASGVAPGLAQTTRTTGRGGGHRGNGT